MIAVLRKEIVHFFGSLIGPMTICVFLVVLGLITWVLPEYSILNYPYATLDQLFTVAPAVFIFLVPAVTMRIFAEEHISGNFEMLRTKPLTLFQIVMGKFLAAFLLVVLAVLPTLIYFYTVYELGAPRGNIDTGEIIASYMALLCLTAAFTSIGIFTSALSKNQIVAFLSASFLCFFFHWVFYYASRLPVFFGRFDDLVQRIGIDHHYLSMSRGVLDTRDVIYFLSFCGVFILLTLLAIGRER